MILSDEFGSIESVKAASELIAPVSMTILEVNQKLEDNPGLINASPEKDGKAKVCVNARHDES